MKRTRPYTVCLMGASLDGGNLGVCALAASLVRLVHQARPQARILMLYGERRGGVRRVPTAAGAMASVRVLNTRLSPRAPLGEHLLWLLLLALAWRCLPPLRRPLLRRNLRLHALAEADFIGTIHAGDSFSDIYGLRRFLIGVVPDAIALLLGKPLVLLPQTYGPFTTALGRRVAQAILRRAARLYARDRDSLAWARGMLIKTGARIRSRFCPDVAFALEPIETGCGTIEPPLPCGAPHDRAPHDRAPMLVGLNVSGLLAIGGYTRRNMFALASDANDLTAELIAALMRETPAHVLIVPHVIDDSDENDVVAGMRAWHQAATRHGDRVHLLTGSYGPGHVKHIIGQCDLFIGARMHACIAALSQGVPALGIAYSPKFRGVFETAGVGELALDARRLAAADIVRHCLAALARREALRARLQAQTAELQARLRQCFEEELADMTGVLTPGRQLSGPKEIDRHESPPRTIPRVVADRGGQ